MKKLYLLLALCLFIILVPVSATAADSPNLIVNVLDVGQGDSIFVELPNSLRKEEMEVHDL